MSEIEVSRRDVLKRMGGLAAAMGLATALPNIEAPHAEPVEVPNDVMVIDEDEMRVAFAKIFAPNAMLTAKGMQDAMMIAVTGKVPDEYREKPAAERSGIEPQRSIANGGSA